MATYGSFPQLVGSTEEWVDDLQIDRAANGATKARAFYSAKKRKWMLKHILSASDVGTLQTFYDTYRTTANTFTWKGDNTSYTVLFDGAPQIRPLGSAWSEVEVRFVQQ